MPRDRRGERDLSTERGVVFRSSEVNTRGVNKDINKGGPGVRGDERGGEASEESSARKQKVGIQYAAWTEDNGCSRERERELCNGCLL